MSSGEQRVILIVEDEILIALMEKQILEKYDYKVLIANTGENAIDLINNSPDIDLILMDIDLGNGIDGAQAAKKILENHDIPLIFLSSYSDKEVVEKTEEITSYGYIVKNTNETVIIASIKMAFRLFESKKREKEKEDNYREIFNSTNEAIFIDDASNGRMIDVNESMLSMYGYSSKEEVIRGNIGDLSANIEPFTEDVAQNHIKKAIEEGPQTFEWLAKKKNGEILWTKVSLRKTEITGKNRILAVVRDITDRKSSEKALKDVTEIFSLFIKYSPIYAFIKEVTPNESRVLYASENYIDMVGIPGSKMRGKTMYDLFPPEFAKKITDDDWNVISDGEILNIDEELNNKYYITIKFPITQGDKKLLAGYTIDITERKKAEQKIKDLLHEKEVILKEVHHRIK